MKHSQKKETINEQEAASQQQNFSECASPSDEESVESQQTEQKTRSRKSRLGGHAYLNKSAKTGKEKKGMPLWLLIVLIVVVSLIALASISFLVYALFFNDSTVETGELPANAKSKQETIEIQEKDSEVETVEIPVLTSLIGKTQSDAVEALGGTVLTTEKETDKTEIKAGHVTIVTVSLDKNSSTDAQSIYLTLNSKGTVVLVNYSVSLSALGITTTTFTTVFDDGTLASLIESAGVSKDKISISTPAVASYRKSDSDGNPITDSYTVSGSTGTSGASKWSAELNFDYSTYNVTNDEADISRYLRLTLS
jgi:hypothetical protein